MLADTTHALARWWAPALAFVAGIVSFASPCVFPLVPGYLSFVTGESAVDGWMAGDPERAPSRRLLPIVLFIGGFTLVFALLGAFASTVRLFKGSAGQTIAGLVVVTLGVLMIGYALGRGSIALYVERRPFLHKVRPGVAGAFPLGMAFAAGWTPCIGPILGAILGLAATEASLSRGIVLLGAYSLGLAVPFLVAAFAVESFLDWFQRFRRYLPWVQRASGALLVAVGLLMATGQFTRMAGWLQRLTPDALRRWL